MRACGAFAGSVMPDPFQAMQCLARGPGWTWNGEQCVQQATSGWGQAACQATGGTWTWDGMQWQCVSAQEQQQVDAVTAVAQQVCAAIGGTYNTVSGECLYPPSSQGLVQASQGACAPGQIQTTSGCMVVRPTGGEGATTSGSLWKPLLLVGGIGIGLYLLLPSLRRGRK